jgi:hypothetical protein
MKKVFGTGDDIYLNPRAVPRAFVASRYRSFSNREQMLAWISSPLLSPRETVLVRDSDLSLIPEWFRREARRELDGIDIGRIAQTSAAEKGALLIKDQAERHKINVFRPVWGASAGDELAIQFRPDQPLDHCFVSFKFSAAIEEKCGLTLNLRGPHGAKQIPVELTPSLNQELEPEGLRSAAADLGRIEKADYHLFFEKTAECKPWIDSVRLAKSVPEVESQAGTAVITLYEPNRLSLTADLNRSSFLVLSEVFYPGWEALVDGQPAPIIRGNLVLRAIPVPAGKHTIELRFRSKTFLWGLLIGLVSMIGAAGFLLLTRVK